MTPGFATRFAADWIDAWNAHDLSRVLAHYNDDFEMRSPMIARFAGEPSGRLRGKPAIGAYWRKALDTVPDLRFELLATLTGGEEIVLVYRGAHGGIVSESLRFDARGKVAQSAACYAEDAASA